MEGDELRAEFERCWPWLSAALDVFGPTHTKEQIWRVIVEQEALFFPGKNCAVLAELIRRPIGFTDFNIWLAGGDLEEILASYPAYEEYARSEGCRRIIACGRRGWLRVLGPDWKEFGVRRAKSLIDDSLEPLLKEFRDGIDLL